MLMRALELEPNMALAHAALLFVYGQEFINRWNDPGPDHLQRGLEFARRYRPTKTRRWHTSPTGWA